MNCKINESAIWHNKKITNCSIDWYWVLRLSRSRVKTYINVVLDELACSVDIGSFHKYSSLAVS